MNALASHAISVYAEMEKTAKLNDRDELVFEGAYTKLFDGLGISRVYYSSVRKLLEKTGCIYFAGRGARGHGSRIVLHRPPTSADFTNSTLTERRDTARLVVELETRVAALEAWRLAQTGEGGFNIMDALRSHERSINKLQENAVEQERANAKAT